MVRNKVKGRKRIDIELSEGLVLSELDVKVLSENADNLYYLGIDPATESGIALMNRSGDLLLCESVNIKRLSGLGSQVENPGRFYLSCYEIFEDYISNIVKDYGIIGSYNIICGLEHPKFLVHSLRFVMYVQMGIISIIQLLLERYGVLVHLLNPKSIKKFCVGNGNAKKELMLLRSRDFGYLGNNHNIADAIHISNYVRLNHCLPI
jgi:hypothetical protein